MQNVLFGNTLAVVGDCQNNLVIFNGAFATVRFVKNTAKSVIAAIASAVTIATAVILIFKDFPFSWFYSFCLLQALAYD